MNWEEFIDRYINNFEEFVFKYKDYKLELLYAPKGEGFTYYLILNKKIIETNTFNSPLELLQALKIENQTLEEIWYELEWR